MPFREKLFGALGGLLAFGGPVQPYPTTSAAAMTAAAWAQTGKSMRAAMRGLDEEIEAAQGRARPSTPRTDRAA